MKLRITATIFFCCCCPFVQGQIASANLQTPQLHSPLMSQVEVHIPAERRLADLHLAALPEIRPCAMDFSTQDLPFFCRQELKAGKLPGPKLRLRIGSVEATDWLEQKPNAVHP